MSDNSVAKALLEEFWDFKLPIDPEYFARKLGLTVVESKDLGLSSGHLDVEKKIIRINPSELKERQRFTIAHELGHFCLNHGSSYRDTTNCGWIANINPRHEQLANQFAADLLMPAIAVKALVDIKGIKDPVKLREIFGVSSTALNIRLNSLGYFL